MYKNIDYFKERDNMKEIYSCDTMCTAKFFTSTIYLQSGQTHSCYHPLPHQIPLDEIKNNPSALHNTEHKKQRRKQMLLGEQPSECNYCWRVEAINNEQISDRIIKSKNETLLTPDAHNIIKEFGWDHNYNPSYLEISFGNECNMRCAYCHPKASSSWMKEMELHGPFNNAEHLQVLEEKIYPEDDNPYVEAFWEWWPELRKNLKVIRVTGGEPLLQQNVWKFIDMLSESDDCSELIFQINTNLNIKNKLVKRLCDKINYLLDNNKIKKFTLYSSIESWGERATYTRNGLDLELFENNIRTIMKELTRQRVDKFTGIQIMNTFNIMSVTSYKQFLEKVIQWRKELQNGKDFPKIMFDIPHCTEPSHWTLIGLPDEYDQYFDVITEYFDRYRWNNQWKNYPKEQHDQAYSKYFSEEEFRAWRRVLEVWKDIVVKRSKVNTEEWCVPRQVDDARRNWFLFIQATDKRRKTDFKEIFPEMSSYYDLCGSLADINTIEYNRTVHDALKDNKQIDFHWDDDFVWHHPQLAQNCITYRKIKNYPTSMFDNDKLVGTFGDE